MGNFLQPRLHLKVAQKQILTPGLVQMVSVLALNRLELREMINQEMVANPVLEELGEESEGPVEIEDDADEMPAPEQAGPGAEAPTERVAGIEAPPREALADDEPSEAHEVHEGDGHKEIQDFIREELIRDGANLEAATPFDEFDANAFFNQYLDSGAPDAQREREEIERAN